MGTRERYLIQCYHSFIQFITTRIYYFYLCFSNNGQLSYWKGWRVVHAKHVQEAEHSKHRLLAFGCRHLAVNSLFCTAPSCPSKMVWRTSLRTNLIKGNVQFAALSAAWLHCSTLGVSTVQQESRNETAGVRQQQSDNIRISKKLICRAAPVDASQGREELLSTSGASRRSGCNYQSHIYHSCANLVTVFNTWPVVTARPLCPAQTDLRCNQQLRSSAHLISATYRFNPEKDRPSAVMLSKPWESLVLYHRMTAAWHKSTSLCTP